MERRKLLAHIRNQLGKGPSRGLRHQGLIPAIVYGPRTHPKPVYVPISQLKKSLHTGWESVLFDLMISGNGESQTKIVMIKELQIDPVSTNPVHIDFYEVAMDREIAIEVPIELVGTAVGVEKGGLLQLSKRTLEVECLPSNIPDGFKIDISSLDIGDSIHVGDIPIKEGAKVLVDSDLVVASVLPPVVEEVPEKVEEEVAEEVKEAAEEVKEAAEERKKVEKE